MSYQLNNTPKTLASKSIDLSTGNEMLKVNLKSLHVHNTQPRASRRVSKKVPTFNHLMKNNPRLYEKSINNDRNTQSNSHL